MSTQLKSMLTRHEGLRLKAYRDTAGNLTIGVGRNLDDVGIDAAEADMLLERDIERARMGAGMFSWFPKLDSVRQDCVIDMIFNLGLYHFSGFGRMIAAIEVGDYEAASDEMLSSAWAVQVQSRAKELATMMRTGAYL